MTESQRVRQSIDPNHHPCEVGPLEAFSDEPAPEGIAESIDPNIGTYKGPRSRTVRHVFGMRCSGYRIPPTSEELYAGMRLQEPTKRDNVVLLAWIMEATEREWFRAWTEQAYSWRMLARVLKRTRYPCWGKIRIVNKYAKNMALIDKRWLPIY